MYTRVYWDLRRDISNLMRIQQLSTYICVFTVPICMPSDAADFTGRMATVTGWGRLKYGGGVPSVLQEVQVSAMRKLIAKVFDDRPRQSNLTVYFPPSVAIQVPIIENSVCQEMFHTAGHNKKILSSFLCAGYANGQKDSCEVSTSL